MKLFAWASALALSLGAASFSFGQLTGKVTLEGKAPAMNTIDMSAVKECAGQHPDPVTEQTVVVDDKGNLANVIVSIKKEEGQELNGEMPKEPAVIDQKGCMYSPHVLAVAVGQDLMVKNDDPFMHNVHSLPTINPPFNFAQPNKDEGKKVDPPKAAEYIKVKCDVHPWMGAWIGVFEHPFFAVTKTDGTFSINTKGLADGDYTVQFWHEQFADTPAEEKVSIKGGKAEVNHVFKAEGAMAEPANPATVNLASAKQPAMSCCSPDNVSRKAMARANTQ
jgi:hypothetical protein